MDDLPVPPFATSSIVFHVGAPPAVVVCKNWPLAIDVATEVSASVADV